jgi:uncharacterized repeat protein (TIGR01451 family)
MARRTALLTLLALVAGILPLVLGPTAANAAPGSATGTLDFDRPAGVLDDYDLGYTINVSNTTPAAGDDITVTLTWNETLLEPFGYSDVNLCWDAPAGWAGAGGVPITEDQDVYTPADTPLTGSVTGTDVPGLPLATVDFTSTSATGERADITSYGAGANKVFRFCAHADAIDARISGLVDATDDLAGTMTVTLEAPASGPADFEGLLATDEYVTGGANVPPSPYVSLDPPQSPGSTSQTLSGLPSPFSYDYADSGGAPSTPIVVTPSGSLLTFSLETQASHGTAVVAADGSYTYTPSSGYTGDDSFEVEVNDGDGSSVATVDVAVLPNEAALSVTKSADETSVLVGESIHYTIEVANTGGLPVTGITLADTNAPDCAATIPTIAVQDSEVVECTYLATAGDVGTYSNVATASSADLTAPVPSNQVDVEVVNAATPRLEIRASSTQTSVEAGDVITYEIEVTNSGGVPLTGVTVTDANAPACARTIGSLAVGARSLYTCTLTTTGGMVGNRANTATADSAETDPVVSSTVTVAVTVADGTTAVPYECTPPGLEAIATTIPITASDDIDPAEPDQTVTWSFRNQNPSIDVGVEADLNWIQVEYAVPNNIANPLLTLVNPPGQTANPTIGNSTMNSPANGSAVRFRTPNSGTIHVAANGALTYNGQPVVLPQLRVTGAPTAAARGTNLQWRAPKITVNVQTANIGNVPCNPNNANTVVLSTRVAPANPILDVDKSVSQQAALPGQTVTYTVQVRNRGNVGLTGVTIADPVAPDCAEAVGALAAGATQTITCTREIVEADLGRLRNVATGDSDQTPAVSSNPADVLVTETAIAGLDVDLVAAAPTVVADDPADWTITIQNTGNTDLTDVSLDAADDSDCEEQDVPATVAVGTTATVECSTPTEGLLTAFGTGATVSNQATVTANDTDPVSSEVVEVDVTIPPTGWTDVEDWYAPAADWLDHWNLADGYADGTRYRGAKPITRAAFLRMVWRLAGEPAGPNPPTHRFTDVPEWAAEAVAWAAEDPAGPRPALMTGLTATRFGPNATMRRAQAVRLLFRFANRIEAQTVPHPPTHHFRDVPAWVAGPVAWAAFDPAGPPPPLMTGLTRTRFGGAAQITRAQTARVLFRLADRLDL